MANPGRMCHKVRNPCKICLRKVTTKTGLQCCGACQSWVHFKCSNYTPGKISDIKKGIIKVNCPCPDCTTQLPKEYRTDKKVSCSNAKCPANQLPKCANKGCPSYDYEPAPGTPGYQDSVNQVPSDPWPGSKCGADCKKFPASESVNSMKREPPQPPAMPAKGGTATSPRCGRPECKVNTLQGLQVGPLGAINTRGDVLESHDCHRPPVGDAGVPQSSFTSMQPSISVVEQMCSTLGILSKQLNELMIRMKDGMRQRSGSAPAPCTVAGTRAKCPKPCNCPGNPNP